MKIGEKMFTKLKRNIKRKYIRYQRNRIGRIERKIESIKLIKCRICKDTMSWIEMYDKEEKKFLMAGCCNKIYRIGMS